MYRDKLDSILVVWLNPGAAYPEVLAQMAEVRASVPHFLEVAGDQPGSIDRNGPPSDVVPVNYTPLGRVFVKNALPYRVQSTFDCCFSSIWTPLQKAMKNHGIRTVIRGQRKSEQYTSPITDGYVDPDGVTYLLPIENWTDEEVFAYLRDHNVTIPSYYETEVDSHDCWNCTGYLASNVNRIRALPGPMRAEVDRRLAYIADALISELSPIKTLLSETH